jgi:anion-transporting  ArsA/GET3 family ATPase
MNAAELLKGKRVCICAGSGGVGKTTISAAIALGMAARGARVAVVTIDPAKRLAGALGLEELENEPRLVAPDRLAAFGLELKGELWAMMLDPKRTFDELIDKIAPTPARAEEIKANRVYRSLSTAVAGSQEFTAVSKLYELAHDSDFDLLVLDTPPSRNAIDFFEAPHRLTSFLEGRALKAFLRPTGIGMRLLELGVAPLLPALRRITGVEMITDLSLFFGLLGDMTEDFTIRAAEVQRLLRAPDTAFALVTSAQSEPIDEAIWLRHKLRETGLPFAGVVVNRFHHDLAADGNANEVDAQPEQLAQLLGEQLAASVAENLDDYQALAQRDAVNVHRLAGDMNDEPLLLVPYFDDDVHDIDGLLRVHSYLFASDAERAEMIDDVVA